LSISAFGPIGCGQPRQVISYENKIIILGQLYQFPVAEPHHGFIVVDPASFPWEQVELIYQNSKVSASFNNLKISLRRDRKECPQGLSGQAANNTPVSNPNSLNL
jgi:hypothetical protein